MFKRAQAPPPLVRIAISIDPAVTANEESSETGIIACGVGKDRRGYVLSDYSCRQTPDGWARRAIMAYQAHHADIILGEVNNGGDMVEQTLRTAAQAMGVPMPPYLAIHASRGKRTRAEPVAALYEQGRVSHIGAYDELEDQMCNWTPDSPESPDRMDALVWALTKLMLESEARIYV
jgi:predicted phage terminase large subunit-like protein